MSAVALAGVFAAGLALVLIGAGAVVFARQRAGDKVLERRLRRVAAPLAAPGTTQRTDTESIFRKPEREARLGWLWRPLERRYPLVHAPRALALATGAGGVGAAGAWFSLAFLRVPAGGWALPLVAAAGAGAAWYALRWQQARREAAFIRQFPEVVDQIVRLAGAGVPAVEALSVVAEDVTPPVRPVLKEVCDALLAGLDADTALRLTTERVRLSEFTMFASVLRLQRRAGGGISGAFANLAATLRERRKTALKAHASTAQTRLTLLVLTVMPVIILVAQRFVAPESVEVLFHTERGTTLLQVGTGLIVAGLLVAKAIAARGAR